MKKTPHYKGHKWTTAELRLLMKMWAEGASVEEIAAVLTSTKNAIAKMVVKLRASGIPLQRRTRGHVAGRRNTNWTQAEVEYLVRRRGECATSEAIGNELGRTVHAVQSMISVLKSEGVPVGMLGSGVRRLWNAEMLKVAAIGMPQLELLTSGSTDKSSLALAVQELAQKQVQP